MYSIVAEYANNTNTITITALGSEVWPGDVVLNEKARGEVFYSDGMKWVTRSFGDIAHTSVLTAGRVNLRSINLTMSVASNVNQVEALRVILASDVKTGAWAQAIFAQTDYMTDGLAHGAGSVICAELSLPASSVVRGTYYVWQSEIDCPANCVMNANPIGVMSVSVWGTNKTQFDDVGLLFDISGVTSGALKFWYDNTDGAYDEWLKVRTPSGIRYIPLMDGQAA